MSITTLDTPSHVQVTAPAITAVGTPAPAGGESDNPAAASDTRWIHVEVVQLIGERKRAVTVRLR